MKKRVSDAEIVDTFCRGVLPQAVAVWFNIKESRVWRAIRKELRKAER